MSLDKLPIQTIVFANLILAADIQIIAEFFDVHWVVQVFVFKVMHVLASCTVETDDCFARVRTSHINGIDSHVEAIGVVDTCIRPHLVKATFPHIHAKLKLLSIVCDFFAEAIGDTHALRICILGRWIVRPSNMNTTVGGRGAITTINTPGWLFVSEHMVLVFAGDVCVVGVLVKNYAPRMIQTTTLQVDTTRRTSVAVVAVDFVAVSTDNIQVPIVEHKRPWLSLDSTELLQEGTCRAIIHENTVGTLAGHIEIVIKTKRCPPRTIQAATSRLDENIEKCSSVSIVSQHRACLEIGDEHCREEGEGRRSSKRRSIHDQLEGSSTSGVLWCSAADVCIVDDCRSGLRCTELAFLGV